GSGTPPRSLAEAAAPESGRCSPWLEPSSCSAGSLGAAAGGTEQSSSREARPRCGSTDRVAGLVLAHLKTQKLLHGRDRLGIAAAYHHDSPVRPALVRVGDLGPQLTHRRNARWDLTVDGRGGSEVAGPERARNVLQVAVHLLDGGAVIGSIRGHLDRPPIGCEQEVMGRPLL